MIIYFKMSQAVKESDMQVYILYSNADKSQLV